MEISRVPLAFNKQGGERTFEEYSNQAPSVSGEEASAAAYDLAQKDSLGMLLFGRIPAVKELESTGATPLSPEEANKRFPGLPTPFREPINPYVAQLHFDQEVEKAHLSNKIANGPQDGWNKSKQFGAGLIAHALDPVEFGVGAVSGWGVGGLVARGALGAKLAATGAAIAEGGAGVGAATRIGFNAAEAGAGNLIENVLQEGVQAYTEGRDGTIDTRSTREVITDIAISTFAATALGTGVKELSFRGNEKLATKKAFADNLAAIEKETSNALAAPDVYQIDGTKRFFQNTSPEADLANARANLSVIESGLRPDNRPLMKALAQETSVLPQNFGKPAYNFEPIVNGSFEGKKFYAATRNATGDMLGGNKTPLGDDFGFGTHISDNPGVANAAAARSMADSVGTVHEVQIANLKPIDLDQVAPEGNFRDALGKILDAAGFDDVDATIKTESLKDVLTYIRNGVDANLLPKETMDMIKQGIQESGYDSMISSGKTNNGFDHVPHNHLTVLDDNLLTHTNSYAPDSAVINAPSKQDIDATMSRNSDPDQRIFSDKQRFLDNKERLKELRDTSLNETANIRKETDEILAEFDEQHKIGVLSDGDKIRVDLIREGIQKIEDQHTLLKAFATCVRA